MKMDENKEFKKIKGIVTYDQKWYNFIRRNTIKTIVFDTYGYYNFLKESIDNEKYDLAYKFPNEAEINLFLVNKKEKYYFRFYRFYFRWNKDKIILIKSPINKNTILKIIRKSENVWDIEFLESVFTYDDIIFIMDKFIRIVAPKI
jgi:hypothetical protein